MSQTTKLDHRASQLILGAFVLLLAAFTVIQDARQAACVENVVKELTESLEVRGAVARSADENMATLVERVSNAETNREVDTALNVYLNATKRLNKIRERNPFPPYPEGRCD